MAALLARAVHALSVRSRITRRLITEGCPPDCAYRYQCVNHQYFRQECCNSPDCSTVCGAWVLIGAC